MIVTTNNPIKEVIEVCNKLYPLKHCGLSFVHGLKEKEDAWAVTFWPDDGNLPEISIDVSAPYDACVELIAHEFAHVVAGEVKGHNKDWENAFSEINIAFNNAQEE